MGLPEVNTTSLQVGEKQPKESLKVRPLQRLRRLGDNLLYRVDELIVGEYQPAARVLMEVGGDEKTARGIALRRIVQAGAIGAQVTGSTFATAQLLAGGELSHIYASLGVGAQVLGRLVDLRITNRNGVEWQHTLDTMVMRHSDKFPAITELLKSEGINSEEIGAFNQLSGRIYNAELNSPRLKNIQTTVTPTLIAGIIYPHANEVLTGIFASAAVASYWISRTAYNSMSIVRAAATRAARSAKASEWLRDLLEDHLSDVFKLNLISQTPTIATIIALLSTSKEYAAGLIFATTSSLSGLVNTLTTKRAAVEAHRATEIISGLGNVMKSEALLLTDDNWNAFLHDHPSVEYEERVSFEKGMILQNITSQLPDGTATDIKDLSLDIRSGEVTVIKAASGKGKSQFWLGPRHITRFLGESYIVENGKVVNSKSLPHRSDIKNHLQIFSIGLVNPKHELVDIFNPIFKIIDTTDYGIKEKDQARWNDIKDIEDSLLRGDIAKREAGKRNYLNGAFLEASKVYREKRLNWVYALLQESQGNLNIAGMHGNRVFGQDSLSDGQRQRIVMLLALQIVKYMPNLKTIILDEPFDKLDKDLNLELQFAILEQIQNTPNGPGIVVISHPYAESLQNRFGAKLIDLD